MPKPFPVVSLLIIFLTAIASNSQTPEPNAISKPDYSKEASIVEQYTLKVRFENDGTSIQEQTARVKVQSDAGLQQYGLLTFPYASGTGTFEIVYVRVKKVDGPVVDTLPDTIQDTASEITRQAPFYSDLHEKSVPVKGLGLGDILEYKTVATHASRFGNLRCYTGISTTFGLRTRVSDTLSSFA